MGLTEAVCWQRELKHSCNSSIILPSMFVSCTRVAGGPSQVAMQRFALDLAGDNAEESVGGGQVGSVGDDDGGRSTNGGHAMSFVNFGPGFADNLLQRHSEGRFIAFGKGNGSADAEDF